MINYTILINGESTESFNAAEGLRQGDPISPFSFAIAMEYISRNLNRLKEDKTFRFRPRCSKLGITQLSFADDLLLVARGDILFVTALHKCFLKFSQASRLLANLIKSLVYFGGIAPMESSRILQHLGFAHGELPFKYLGIPLSARKITLVQWLPLIQKIIRRISSWTTRKLSFAGRLQLVQIVIFAFKLIGHNSISYQQVYYK